MKTASRTLVKSPPELWEMIDQPDRMQGLMCGLLGHATEVTVEEREPESLLRWEASDEGADAWIEVQLAEKGWGTNVKLNAENGGEPTKLEGWLDAVLEELATPQKRPFSGMGEELPPEPPVAETPPPEPLVAETPEPESPEPGTPEPETDEPEPADPAPQPEPGKLRRFFGL
jgi:outer membrane biosynthesis protein TonB